MQADQTIHETSNHALTHKMVAYKHMINRLISAPMDEADYNKEVNIIKHIT